MDLRSVDASFGFIGRRLRPTHPPRMHCSGLLIRSYAIEHAGHSFETGSVETEISPLGWSEH